ncbi:Holliday junction resolvase RuvX [Microbacterium sp. bgisy207]|uniref:Holliday junction resolvase RuvX n=1 Tax=Microbacterium sp. bgisy207 TaxID=3413800 RepID=UPI003EB8F1D5
MSEFRRGIRLAVDVGRARVGVAQCDPDGMLATPTETIPRTDRTVDRLREVIDHSQPIEVIVGLPINLRGERTASTEDAEDFARQLGACVSVPIRMLDERLSTVSAQSALRASGRSTRSSRTIVDQVAAVVLLQQALDIEKSTGRPPGALLPPAEEPA